jgi:hypothetical protein
MGTFWSVDTSGDLNTAGSIIAAGGITSTSITEGFLPPQLTTTQRNAIPTPTTGLEVFNTTTGQLEFWNGSAWVAVGSTTGVTSLNSLTGALLIVGTTNEITVTPAGSSITLATPQAINTGASVTFAHLALTGLTNSTVVVTDGSDNLVSSSTTTTELGYVHGVTSAIQTQLSLLAPLASPTFTGTVTIPTLTLTSPLTVANGGTGQTTAAAAFNALTPMTTTGDLEYESASNVASRLAIGSSGQVLTVVSGVPAWAAATGTTYTAGTGLTLTGTVFSLTNPVTVALGGTGLATLTAHNVMLGEGTSNVAFAAPGTSGQLFISQGASSDPAFEAMSGDATILSTGVLTLATVNSNVGSFGSSTSIPSFTVNAKGLITAASGNVVIAPAGTLSGTTLNSTVVSSSLTSVGTITSGTWTGTTIAIANGGTGDTSLTAYAVLCGGTTSTAAIQSIASVGTSGQVLTSNGAGALPTFQTSTGGVTSITGTTNEVIASASTGAVTLSLPQAIATTSSVTFGEITIGSLGQGQISTGGAGSPLQIAAANTLTLVAGSGSGQIVCNANAVVPITSNGVTLGTTSLPFSNIFTKQEIVFQETGAGTNNIELSAPASIGTSYSLVLPSAQGGASTFLQNDGSGNLSWTAGGSGTVNSGTATHLSYYATSTNAVSDAASNTISGSYTFSGGAGALTMSSSTIAMGSNKITGLANGTAASDAVAFAQVLGFRVLQVVSNNTSTTTTSSTTTYADATNLNVTITPTLSTSTIWIIASVNCLANNSATQICSVGLRIVRGSSTVISTYEGVCSLGGGSATSGRNTSQVLLFKPDSPATTSATTYKIQMNSGNGTATASVNDQNIATGSFIYAIEIG